LDVDLTEAGLLAIDWSAEHNTLISIPEDSGDWLGHQVVVQPHWTLSQVYAKDTFIGSNVPEEADQVLFFNGTNFDTYFLLQAEGYDQWVAQADDELKSADHHIIPPGVGSFIQRPEGAESIELMLTGEARASAFAQPLVAGYNLLASPRPIDLDFDSRALLLSDGFLGSRDPDAADQIQLWQGDNNPSQLVYESYFLLDAGDGHQHWTEIGPDLPNVNPTKLFRGNRAFFLKRSGPSRLDYLIPAID